MMEKIIKISEDEEVGGYDGFKIETDKQVIFFGISNGQNCCENWGYLTTNDDIKDFEGSELLDITTTDICFNTKKLNDENDYSSITTDDCIFINIQTSLGTLQLVAYNSHNGYYGHEVIIRSKQLNDSYSI